MNSRGKKRGAAEDGSARKALKMTDPDCRLFVGRLPLTVDARAIRPRGRALALDCVGSSWWKSY